MDEGPKIVSDDGVIIVGLEELESRRKRRSIGEIIFWIITHVPGALVIWWGVHVHITKRFIFGTWLLWHPIEGEKALAMSWQLIGVGIWAVAHCGAAFWHRRLLKWLFYFTGAAVFFYGFWRRYFQ